MTDADDASELERLLSDPSAKAVVRAFMRVTPSLTVVVRASDLRVLFTSTFTHRLLGVPVEGLQGAPFEVYEKAVRVFAPDGRPVERHERAIYRAAHGETVVGEEAFVLDRHGVMVPIICNGAPIHNANGELIAAVVVCTDVRRLKALEAELRVAYREMVHRVKNHLQIMSGLIGLDASDPDVTAA
jgi:PAS domain S-box-containing protein